MENGSQRRQVLSWSLLRFAKRQSPVQLAMKLFGRLDILTRIFMLMSYGLHSTCGFLVSTLKVDRL